jgi:hypothetical protein
MSEHISKFTDRMFKSTRSTTGRKGPFIYLIEVSAYNFQTMTLEHLRYGTDGYNDKDAPGYYENRVMSAPDFGRYLLSPAATSGTSKVTIGDVVLANNDRALDHLRDLGIAGQEIKILLGYKYDSYTTFTPLSFGRVEQVLFEFVAGQAGVTDTVTLRFRDRLLDFTLPIQENRYKGNNSPPYGVEGNEDIKSKPKPLLFGEVFNISPVSVNAPLLIYQAADNVIRSFVQVRDSGVTLSEGPPYTSQTDMENNEPVPGTYRPWISAAGSYFRLGATPRGTITCDCIEGATQADLSAGQVAYRILTQYGKIPPADISMADLNALNILNGAAVGIFIAEESNIQAPIDDVLQSIGASGGFDRLDVYRMRRINLPLAEHATGIILRAPYNDTKVGLNDIRLISIRFIPTNDPDKGVPTYQQTLNYRKNYTVQASDGLAADALEDQRLVNFVNSEYRSTVSNADWIRVGNPLAVKKNMNSLLTTTVSAEEECERQLTLYSGRRDFLELEVHLDFDVINKIDIGDIITVIIPAYGYRYGQPMLITGMAYNTSRDVLTVEVWGGIESVVEELAAIVNEPGAESRGFVGETLVGWTAIGMLISPLGIDRAIIDYRVLESLVGLAS